MTSGFHLAATQICNALRISHINFEDLTQPMEMFCKDCKKNYMHITSETTPGDIRVATLEHYQREHFGTWRSLVAAGDACLEAANAAWSAGENFLSAEALIDSASNPYSHELIIVCPVDGCGTSFSEKIPPHAQLGDGLLDISHELQHYFISMLAKHYMATRSIHDLPIPSND